MSWLLRRNTAEKGIEDRDSYTPIGEATLSADDDEIDFLGATVVRDDENWHYVIIFPLITEGARKSLQWTRVIPAAKIQEMLQLFFRPCVLEEHGGFDYLGIAEMFQDDMTTIDFHEAVRTVIATLLAGQHMGFKLQTERSIDDDELFLKMELTKGTPVDVGHSTSWMPNFRKRFNTHEQIADAVNLRTPLDPKLYPKGYPCPTRSLDLHRNFEGNDFAPAAKQFVKEKKKYFKSFSELDIIRLSWMRMNSFVTWEQLMYVGIIKQDGLFAVHRWSRVSMFSKHPSARPASAAIYPHGWSSLTDTLQYPGDQNLHYVKEYFGEEVAFFFHWLNFFTAILIIPTVAGVIITVLRWIPWVSNPEHEQYLDISFMVLMILWSSAFLELYNRRSKLYIEVWGMTDYQEQDVERPNFKRALLGAHTEDIRRLTHWLALVVVIVYTVVFNYFISSQRAEMLQHPDGIFWLGYPGKTSEKFAKYVVTINITVVDAIWGKVSPILSHKENHRTSVELRDAMVMKLLAAKVFVYNYPFWYTAFIQRHVEGCNVGGTTCLEYLESSLLVFVFLHVFFVILMAAISVLTTRFSIWQELRSVTNGKKYSYLEAQAKCPAYTPEVEIADFLELITSLGLVMQFSVVLPIIPLLQLGSNLIELRISAYKMVNIFQRVPARGSEGIGSWGESIHAISWLALVVNVGLGVFFLKPMKDWQMHSQVFAFLVIEHCLVALKLLVEAAIPDTNTLTQLIRMNNNIAVDHIFSGDKGSSVKVEGVGFVPNMALTYNADEQGDFATMMGLEGGQFLRTAAKNRRGCDNTKWADVCWSRDGAKNMQITQRTYAPQSPPSSPRESAQE